MILPELLYQRGTMVEKPRYEKAELITRLQLGFAVNLYTHDENLSELLSGGYIHHPIADGANVDYAAMEEVAKRAAEAAKYAGAILTICHAGRNRSGLMSAMIVRHLRGVNGAEAIRIVRDGRPRALANPAFVEYLERQPAP